MINYFKFFSIEFKLLNHKSKNKILQIFSSNSNLYQQISKILIILHD